MIFRVNKTKNYTVMCNHHLNNKMLTLKAKGLLSLMLSLPDDWNYSIEGLEKLSVDGKDAVSSAVKELIESGYIERHQSRDRGKFGNYDYDVYELPKTEKPKTENPHTEKPITENPSLLNTKEPNTKELITKYCLEAGLNNLEAEKFFDYYSQKNWTINGEPIKDIKAVARAWVSKKQSFSNSRNQKNIYEEVEKKLFNKAP